MELKKCKICGDLAPPGKEMCWCCEHAKLHPTEPKEKEKKNERTGKGN